MWAGDKLLIRYSQEKLVERAAVIWSPYSGETNKAQRDRNIEMLRFYEDIKNVTFTKVQRTGMEWFFTKHIENVDEVQK